MEQRQQRYHGMSSTTMKLRAAMFFAASILLMGFFWSAIDRSHEVDVSGATPTPEPQFLKPDGQEKDAVHIPDVKKIANRNGNDDEPEPMSNALAVLPDGGGDDAADLSPPAPTYMYENKSYPYDKGITEIIKEDAKIDGIIFKNSSKVELNELRARGPFISEIKWKGKCWYAVKNFCVIGGQLTMFHDPQQGSGPRGHSLRMCNEFSQHSNLIRLQYMSVPLPNEEEKPEALGPLGLPAPVHTKTKGWVLQFWCQDLFHMTLSLMPAFHTKSHLGPHPDVYVRIAKGKRQKDAYCRIKFGDPRNWEDVRNKRWGGDKQFPFAGNPYWPFYQVITPDPHRMFPLYAGATKKAACYTEGAIDKLYLKDMTGSQARSYSDALLEALKVQKGAKRVCGKDRPYRLTMIDRRGKTRKLTNVPELVEIAKEMGFEAQSVALETIPIRSQLRLITETDVLMGMHGNGITWLQFLQPGSVVVELIGVWYTPYALLWGHTHLHSSMKNNMDFKRQGERVPFAHNTTEVRELLAKAKEKLDENSCGDVTFTPPNQKLENLYKSCAPHC